MGMEGGRCHVEHGHIDEPSQAHGDYHVRDTPLEDAPSLFFAAWDNPLLGER